METEIRFYYSLESEEKIIQKMKEFDELIFEGTFYEKTDQYNHPMKEYDYYSKEIDGRFRVRNTKGDNVSKCMITWKRRLPDKIGTLIHEEEEVEISIKPEDYDNLVFLLNNVLHLSLVESYERYRTLFHNDDIEIAVDRYPFGIAIEVENKSKTKNPEEIIKYWVDKIGLDINSAYKLSWDDKYEELCKEQNVNYENIVTFDKVMPKVDVEFN